MDSKEHACGYYRLRLPLGSQPSEFEIVWGIEVLHNMYHLVPEALESADLFIVQRFFPCQETETLLEHICTLGKPVVYETDDLITELPPTNPSYDWGAPNSAYIYSFISKASAVTVSTEELRRHFSPYHSSIHILPNLIDPNLWHTTSPPSSGPVVIGYAGTITHSTDLEFLEEVLEKVSATYGDTVAFTFMGCATKKIAGLPGFTFIPFEYSFENYATMLQGTPVDIMLVPLEDIPFNRCKSNIKWLEYSACGITGIYSDLPPYNSCIDHGRTGLLAGNSPGQWFAALETLINSPDLRRNMAHAARNEVLDSFSVQAGAPLWKSVYRQIYAAHQNGTPLADSAGERDIDQSITAVRVSIIIPAFNRMELTGHCLQTLMACTNDAISYEVIVVDNGSTDGTAELLKRHIPPVRVLSNDANQGFARACNQGAAAARGDYLLFLNNDTELRKHWLEPLIATMESDETIGAVGSKLLFADDTIQHAGVLIIEDQATPDLLVARHAFHGQPASTPDADYPRPCTALTAACLLIRRTTFEAVGGFDEGYWNGYEDVDLCLKIGAAGFKLIYQPASVVVHFESKSGAERFSKAADNIRRLHDKWLGKLCPDAVIDRQGIWHWIQNTADWHQLRDSSVTAGNDSTRGTEPGLVSIIILTMNQLWCTRECVESIRKSTPEPHEILFVDNGSTDGTASWLSDLVQQNSSYRLIQNSSNLGFAKGCNQGIRQSRGEFILLLNNDTVVTMDWLSGLREVLERHPDTGIVGPMTNSASGIQVVSHPGYSDMSQLPGFARSFRETFRYRLIPNRRIVGFCMMFHRRLVESIGLLDESFGSGNFEDDDYCLRSELAGFRNAIAGDVFIHHYGGQSFEGNRINHADAIMRNLALYKSSKLNYEELDETTLRRMIPMNAIQEARRLAMSDELDKAVDVLMQKGIRVAPENPNCYLALADILMEAGRHEDTLQVLPEMPQDTSTVHKLEIEATCHSSLGNESAAEQAAHMALSLDACSSQALKVLGTLAARRGERAKAESLFRQAIAAAPYSSACWMPLAMLLWGTGEHDAAWQAAKRSVVLNPLHLEAVDILLDMAQRMDRENNRSAKQTHL